MQFSALENAPGEKFDPDLHGSGAPTEVDEAFIRRAFDHANLNVLRIALFQHTGDPELAAMKVIKHSRAGSPFLFSILSVKRRSKGTPDRRRRGTPFSDMMLVC